jgi:uncharacterized protein with beta-barrel porin domain
VWSQTFGGAERIDGDATTGSNTTTDRMISEMVGAEYRISRDTAFGFGFGGGTENFSVANGLGSGHYDFGEVGAYGTQKFNSYYVTGGVVVGGGDVKTSRTDPLGAGLQASYNATTLAGRIEFGDQIATPYGLFAPYGALKGTVVSLPSYSEDPASVFALNYASQTMSDGATELGFRISNTFVQSDSNLTLGGQFAWAHDFDPKQSANVSFASLPSSNFTVYGAAAAADSALASLSAKAAFNNGFAVEARVEGQFASNLQSIGGRATISYRW